jgi:hypothetical protein
MAGWQRELGYAYDLAAPATTSAVIDCEPFSECDAPIACSP